MILEEWEKKETDILCFRCKQRYGLDVPGCRIGEATLCVVCFKEHMKRMRKVQADYLKDFRRRRQ